MPSGKAKSKEYQPLFKTWQYAQRRGGFPPNRDWIYCKIFSHGRAAKAPAGGLSAPVNTGPEGAYGKRGPGNLEIQRGFPGKRGLSKKPV